MVDMDLILGESDGTLNLYENDGSDIFTETTNYKSIDVGEASAPFVVDWHDDGDLDILVGSDSGGVTLYQNSGMYRFTSFTASLGTRMDVGIYSTPATADYDADGDTDLVVGEFDGGLELFINKGTGTFETATALTMTTGAEIDANIPAPDLIDWSSDGDFDVLVGAGDGTMTLFKNNGADVYDTGTKLTDTTGATIDVGHYAVPQYTDWDGDGDQDVVVGHAESLALLTNNGSNKFTVTDDLAGSDLDSSYHSPAVVDWNDDGVKDLILASYDGKIRLYLNDGSSAFNSGTVLTDEDSVDIDVGQQARLAVTDWDSDGYKDMIVGSVNGKVYLFLQDADADGYVGDDDCNNKKSTIYDDATETCGDGVDQDCDGSDTVCPATTACGDGIISTGETCDDANTVSNDGCSAACLRETAWYLDSDGDRYGDTNHVSYSATRPTGYAKLSTDCDDSNNAIYPTATETCNDLDDDCNDIVDDATVTYYADADNDRYGDTASPVTGDCDQPSGTATLSDDCNDADGLILGYLV
jgi:cysteine-rich repeat protein